MRKNLRDGEPSWHNRKQWGTIYGQDRCSKNGLRPGRRQGKMGKTESNPTSLRHSCAAVPTVLSSRWRSRSLRWDMDLPSLLPWGRNTTGQWRESLVKYSTLSILSVHQSTDICVEGTQDMYVQGDTGEVCSKGHMICVQEDIGHVCSRGHRTCLFKMT